MCYIWFVETEKIQQNMDASGAEGTDSNYPVIYSTINQNFF